MAVNLVWRLGINYERDDGAEVLPAELARGVLQAKHALAPDDKWAEVDQDTYEDGADFFNGRLQDHPGGDWDFRARIEGVAENDVSEWYTASYSSERGQLQASGGLVIAEE